ncbi:MAG: hypothetical protein KKF50_03365 [Nanoarchaeota archaeon]|nr:hypothetical protein [Nanoarchaeota archaeon]
MRIKLKRGKQKELIYLAKDNKSWLKLSKCLSISPAYLSRDLKYENRILSEEIYLNLCKIANVNFEEHIVDKLEDNWGQSKGGNISSRNTKDFAHSDDKEDLAETMGIILGDGHVSEIKREKKIRVYCIRIAGNSKTDKDYIFGYIPELFMKVFNEKGSVMTAPNRNCGYFTIYGKNLIEYIKSLGIKSGNKKMNNQGIPCWIKSDKILLARCAKGLIDTDGSIHKISRNNKNLRIDFTSKIPQLLTDTHEAFVSLGFNPSKIICENHFFLSRQSEVEKYVREIGFSNSKNLKRYLNLRNN